MPNVKYLDALTYIGQGDPIKPDGYSSIWFFGLEEGYTPSGKGFISGGEIPGAFWRKNDSPSHRGWLSSKMYGKFISNLSCQLSECSERTLKHYRKYVFLYPNSGVLHANIYPIPMTSSDSKKSPYLNNKIFGVPVSIKRGGLPYIELRYALIKSMVDKYEPSVIFCFGNDSNMKSVFSGSSKPVLRSLCTGNCVNRKGITAKTQKALLVDEYRKIFYLWHPSTKYNNYHAPSGSGYTYMRDLINGEIIKQCKIWGIKLP